MGAKQSDIVPASINANQEKKNMNASDAAINGAIIKPHYLQAVSLEKISITCHEGDVPHFVAEELVRLYGNIYSSIAHFKVSDRFGVDVNTYIVRKDGNIATVFLFRLERNEAIVLNEGIRINDEDAQRFANYVFTTYRTIDFITFHAVRSEIRNPSFPYQCFNCLEDIVLTMPATAEQYFSGLGGATRNYIKRYMNKLKRNFPSFCHKVYAGHEVDERYIHDIIRFNQIRMADKGKTSGIDPAALKNIVQLVRECGLVSLILIDGKVCAGTINYQVGRNYFLESISHDPVYNEYRLGTLCCYLTICECIARGGDEYHFLWGQHEYKFRLLGIQRDLDHFVIYRSRAWMLLHAGTALKNVRSTYLRKLQLWVRRAQQREEWMYRFPVRVAKFLHTF